jgi:iron complex outermembrane recepter protein
MHLYGTCGSRLLLFFCLSPVFADAQEAADSGTPLDTVVVTGARVPTALSSIASSVSVIAEDSLQEQLSRNTNVLSSLDVLVPGLTVSQGEFRSGCRTNIRGRAAQFLIDGVPTNDNLRRSTCGSLFGLSPHAIERIEVVRGSTALYGAGAPGGVINMSTRRARSQELEADVVTQWSFNPHERGDSNEYNLYGGIGQALEGWDYYVGAAYNEYGVRRNPNGGIVPGTTFNDFSGHLTLGRSLGQGELRFTGLYYEQDPEDAWATDFTQISGVKFADLVLIPTPRNPYESQAKTEQTVLTLSYSGAEVFGHQVELSLYYHDETLIQRAADFFAGEVFYFDSDASNERLGVRSALKREFTIGSGTVEATYGIDLLEQSYYRPVVDPASGAVIGFVSPEVTLDQYAAFIQPHWRSGRWQVTGGVRYERFAGEVGRRGFDPAIEDVATPGETPDFDLTLFNVGVIYDLTESLQAYGGFSQGAEISEFGRAARGAVDPRLINLEADASNQLEFGLRGRTGAVSFEAAVFYSDSDKAADLQADPTCAGEPLCPLIPLRLAREVYGLELSVDWRASEAASFGGILTYQEGESREPGAPAIPFGTDTLSPPRVTLYAELMPIVDWQNRLQVTYFGSTSEYDAEQRAAGFMNTDSYTLVDLTSSYPLGLGRLALGVSNLLNEEYVNVTNQASGDFFYYLSEGRRATLSYTMRF